MSKERAHDGDEPYDLASATGGAEPEPESAPKKSVAMRLVELATAHYELGCTPDGEPYAIPRRGPQIVRMLRGGRGSLRAELARAFNEDTGAIAAQAALSDACTVIEGRAALVEPDELHLRVAVHGRSLVIDLGDQTGHAVVVNDSGWQVVTTPPVLFRRTALTGVLPVPDTGGDLADLWALLNVRDSSRPLLAALLVAALMPQLPHPILALAGEQGSGKSTAARIISATVDPSPAQLRKSPRDPDTWTTAAAGSWVVALDNVSGIPDWLSDALCRASTGDGDVRRRLYSDGDLHVIAFRRVVVLNGIDLGTLRDDLADRLVTVHLDRITDRGRRRDAEVTRRWQQAHPRVLGALLDLTAQVLAVMPTVELNELPRMADFAYVLAAVDRVLGTDGLQTYLGLGAEMAADVLTSDPVLEAIDRTITGEWTGTAAELLKAITPGQDNPDHHQWRPPKDWPRTPIALRGVLKRRAPTLRRLGWTVEDAAEDAHSKVKRTRLVRPDARETGNRPRDTRGTRSDDVSAAQPLYGAAGVPAGVPGRSAGVAGTTPADPENPRTDTRNPNEPLTSADRADAGVAGVAGADSPSPLPRSVCTSCSAPLLLHVPGRTTCERCRLNGKAAS